MKLFGYALACACAHSVCVAIDPADATCHAKQQNVPNVAVTAPVLLQVHGALHTLHDPSALGAGGSLYSPELAGIEAGYEHSKPDRSELYLDRAVMDLSLSSELHVSAGGSAGVEALEGSSMFAKALPASIVSSFGEQVDGGNASTAESSGANTPEGTIIDVLLDSQLQLSAMTSADSSVANVPDGSNVSTAEMPEAIVDSDGTVVDHRTDQADGIVVEVPLNSQLEVFATTGDDSSIASAHTEDQSPSSGESEESESLSDRDLADDSTKTIDGTQDRDPTGDRGDQAARDDNDLAEDSTDGNPGESIEHQEGGHVDPAGKVPEAMRVDRGRYDEDWDTEWAADDTDHRRKYTHDQASQAEAVKNSLAILGRRPQVAATVMVVAAFLATRAPRCH